MSEQIEIWGRNKGGYSDRYIVPSNYVTVLNENLVSEGEYKVKVVLDPETHKEVRDLGFLTEESLRELFPDAQKVFDRTQMSERERQIRVFIGVAAIESVVARD